VIDQSVFQGSVQPAGVNVVLAFYAEGSEVGVLENEALG